MAKDKDVKKNWFSRHKLLTTVLIVVIIIIGANAISGSNKQPVSTNSTGKAGSSEAAAKTIGIGQAANDGKFEFTVKGVECGRASVGANQYATKTAQGQFCLLTVSVKNVGNEPQGLFGSNQKLLNASGQQYAADDMAAAYLDQNYSTLFSNINPGNKVDGVIVFDVPKDQTPVTAELHDSAFSGGVKVKLQ